jgi:hypothetical protein
MQPWPVESCSVDDASSESLSAAHPAATKVSEREAATAAMDIEKERFMRMDLELDDPAPGREKRNRRSVTAPARTLSRVARGARASVEIREPSPLLPRDRTLTTRKMEILKNNITI